MKTRSPKRETRNLRLGSRSSNLAIVQSRMIARLLETAHPGLKVEVVEIATTGDAVRDKPLKSFGGAGVFVKELETALLDGRIDLAVHSLKDMPTRQPKGLVIGAIVGREDPRDVAIIAGGKRLDDLPPGSVIGSGSQRRRAQLKARYPRLEFAEIRGNVETRIRKVQEGQYAGTILARAGLKRLGLLTTTVRRGDGETGRLGMTVLPLSLMLPAPGQGALGLESRANDRRARRLLEKLHHPQVAACVTAERAALESLGGGCHLPLAALGEMKRQKGKRKKVLRLRAVLGLPDGTMIVKAEEFGAPGHASALGKNVAKALLARGGREILKRLEAGGGGE